MKLVFPKIIELFEIEKTLFEFNFLNLNMKIDIINSYNK
jgi:hypothetical protein